MSDLTLGTYINPSEVREEIEEQNNFRGDPLYDIGEFSVFIDKHSEALIKVIDGYISTIDLLADIKGFTDFQVKQSKKYILKPTDSFLSLLVYLI